MQRWLAGGCHLSRPVGQLLEAAGLHAVELEQHYAPGEPRLIGSLYVGRAGVPGVRPPRSGADPSR